MWHDQKSTYRTYVSISPIYHRQNTNNTHKSSQTDRYTQSQTVLSISRSIQIQVSAMKIKMKEKIRKEKHETHKTSGKKI